MNLLRFICNQSITSRTIFLPLTMNPIPYHHENKSSIIFDLNSKNKTNYNKKRS